ncbi:hypothetical protein JZ751_009964 [Albula glossodonta]|uniref:DNA-directed RNA polymerase III subunit RPC3 n=1 Tax=Albula glossodonta TaxID=121402 RepID=A0A8T2P9S8_9TELE|nr:hypothetical protein JZ751_009964 [Albula glossodonta]
MAAQEVRLCGLLLQEHFGEVVEKVGTHLLRTGAQTLRGLSYECNTPLDLVKKSLCVLVQHGLCVFAGRRKGPGNVVEYLASCEKVLRILRYPRYIYTAKTLYGDTGELIIEEVLQRGHMTMSHAVRTVADRLTHNMEGESGGIDERGHAGIQGWKNMEYSEVVSAFSRLVETHFLQRCPPVAEVGTTPSTTEGPGGPALQAAAPTLAESHPDRYTLPHVNLTGRGKRRRSSEDSDGESRVGKKAKMDPGASEPSGDDGIYWQVNFDRFHQHFRDQAIVSAVASKLDPTSSEIVRTMLRMSEVTTTATAACTQPLSANEIFRALPPSYSISRPVLEQYLSLLVDDPMEFVGKSGDSGGGMYVVNLHKALASLARATLESVVQERFGSRSARIFRLLLRKRHLEQKQVEDFAMIPAKEAKDMLYTLLSENLVQLQEIPKTPDHAPSRTFYLYTANPLPTARLLLQHCYKTVANLIERRLYETKESKYVLLHHDTFVLGSTECGGVPGYRLDGAVVMISALSLTEALLGVSSTRPLNVAVEKSLNLIGFCMFNVPVNVNALPRLLEKSQRIEAILASLQATGAEPSQLTEVEEMITAPERQQLQALRHHVNKYGAVTVQLDSSENQVDETIFLLESYINSTKSPR